jgi:hypothetical protein
MEERSATDVPDMIAGEMYYGMMQDDRIVSKQSKDQHIPDEVFSITSEGKTPQTRKFFND